jgi:alpha-beta hydrolase superfamily lysophospholipase
MREIILKGKDNTELVTYIWDDVKDVKGVLQLVHGSCEHVMRYKEFAEDCNKKGYVLIGNDHRGHGKTAKGKLGFFASEDGWQTIIDDLKVVNDYIKKKLCW